MTLFRVAQAEAECAKYRGMLQETEQEAETRREEFCSVLSEKNELLAEVICHHCYFDLIGQYFYQTYNFTVNLFELCKHFNSLNNITLTPMYKKCPKFLDAKAEKLILTQYPIVISYLHQGVQFQFQMMGGAHPKNQIKPVATPKSVNWHCFFWFFLFFLVFLNFQIGIVFFGFFLFFWHWFWPEFEVGNCFGFFWFFWLFLAFFGFFCICLGQHSKLEPGFLGSVGFFFGFLGFFGFFGISI